MTNQEAIEELKLLESGQRYDTEYTDFDCFKLAIKALEQQDKERWIPVSEGLPSSDGRFEVTVKGCKGKRRVDMCNFYKSADNGCGKWRDAWNGVNVIAWRERGKPHKD